MTAGRPPKDPKDKSARGTLRKNRACKPAQKSIADTARLPSHLEGDARAAWLTLSPVLQQLGVLTIAYAPAVERLCSSWARIRSFEKLLAKDGLTYCSPVLDARGRPVLDDIGQPVLGMVRVRPEVAALQSENKVFKMWLSTFGLDRATLQPADDAPKGEFD
jgi:phage terminase small subunit